MENINNFKTKTIKQIRLWAWTAAVLPITALAGIFFVWRFGTDNLLSVSMIVGETTMFLFAVIWWWWAMYILRNLVKQWDETKERVHDVLTDIKDIKSIVIEVLKEDK